MINEHELSNSFIISLVKILITKSGLCLKLPLKIFHAFNCSSIEQRKINEQVWSNYNQLNLITKSGLMPEIASMFMLITSQT